MRIHDGPGPILARGGRQNLPDCEVLASPHAENIEALRKYIRRAIEWLATGD